MNFSMLSLEKKLRRAAVLKHLVGIVGIGCKTKIFPNNKEIILLLSIKNNMGKDLTYS